MEAVEDSIDPEVRHSLAISLEAHGLLLSPGEQAAVRTEELHNGARVLEALIAAGLGPLSDAPPMMERRSRILAFGVAASAVLGDGGGGTAPRTGGPGRSMRPAQSRHQHDRPHLGLGRGGL